MRIVQFTSMALILATVGLVFSSGCSTNEEPPSQMSPSTTSAQDELPEDVAAELAKLPDADQVKARQQRVCPVTGELLGSMGKPIKVNVEGGDIFVCCNACVDSVKEEPAKYLEKVNAG